MCLVSLSSIILAFSNVLLYSIPIAVLERMADLGYPWPLIEGTGIPLGFFVMTNLKKTQAEFFRDGAARKIEFTISLTKVDPPECLPFADIIGMI